MLKERKCRLGGMNRAYNTTAYSTQQHRILLHRLYQGECREEGTLVPMLTDALAS